MNKQEDVPKIKIIKVTDKKEITVLSQGLMGVIDKKFQEVYQVLSGINLVVVLSLVAIIISVIGIFLDQMRFNNAFYKEYSQKTEVVESTQKINAELLKEIKENQKLIIKLLKK